jgi:hypothetical protein
VCEAKVFMLVFIVPLKSQKLTESWEKTCYLLERTLSSICQQTCNHFRIIVVCNERPIIRFESSFVEYLQVKLPVPKNEWWEKDKDKAKKLRIGADYSKRFNPSYLMVVDADDLVSNKIAAFIRNKSEQNGYFLNAGYVHESGSKLLYYLRKDFGLYCGTSIIIKPNLFELLFEQGIYEHNGSPLLSHGVALENLPFCGGIYSRGNGENIFAIEEFSKNLCPKGDYIAYVKHLFRFRPITAQIKKEFGFYEEY